MTAYSHVWNVKCQIARKYVQLDCYTEWQGTKWRSPQHWSDYSKTIECRVRLLEWHACHTLVETLFCRVDRARRNYRRTPFDNRRHRRDTTCGSGQNTAVEMCGFKMNEIRYNRGTSISRLFISDKIYWSTQETALKRSPGEESLR